MGKVRCGACRRYVNKEDLFRTNGLTNACSEMCMIDLRHQARKSRKPTSSNERRTDGEVPQATRVVVYERDGYRCRYCGSSNSGLHVHHIRYRSLIGEGKHAETNLITLCPLHHELVHTSQKHYTLVLRGVVWLSYVGQKVLVPQFERWYADLLETMET